MSHLPRCPRCGGDVELVFLAPGDKASRCRFCHLVVDLPEGELRAETEDEEVRPDGTRVARRVVVAHSGGVAPEGHEDLMKQLRSQLENAAAASPAHAERIVQALGKLESGAAVVKVSTSTSSDARTITSVSSTTTSGDLAALPPELQQQVAALIGGGTERDAVSVTWGDGKSYSGKLVEERGGKCLIEFGDGTRHWVPSSAIRR